MPTLKRDPLLDALTHAQTLLDDPSTLENPMRPVVLQLIESVRTLEKRLDKISIISDHYQAQLKATNVHLEEMAHTDLLTGLANRREMLERLNNEINRAQRNQKPFSVLEVDIDHFKQVNDNYGHIVGDRVLANIADLMRVTLRSCDTCARWGGEEFLILLPDTDAAGAVIFAERLRQVVADAKFTTQEHALQKTISIGGMCYQPMQSLNELLQQLDAMLYRAKVSGRNCVCFAHDTSPGQCVH